MMTRGIVAIIFGLFFAWGLNTSALAADKSIGFAAPAVTVDELGQIRGGMAIQELRKIIVAGPRSIRDDLARVKLKFPNSPAPLEKPEKINISLPDFDAAKGISEALVTTAGGVKETIGQIAAAVQTVRRTTLQQGRLLLDSDP